MKHGIEDRCRNTAEDLRCRSRPTGNGDNVAHLESLISILVEWHLVASLDGQAFAKINSGQASVGNQSISTGVVATTVLGPGKSHGSSNGLR
jgi:hypothetical protein